MKRYSLEEILPAIDIPSLFTLIEKGLIHYAKGECITSPVGFLEFASPPADVHIKSGAIVGDDFYIVKIASGFYENPKIGLSSCNGLMLLFSQKTGEPLALLCDEGRLTDLRTGIAGAIAAKALAPKEIETIGIVGTGIQAREQLKALRYITPCREVLVYGRDPKKAALLASDPSLCDFSIAVAESIDELAERSRLIVTTTPSRSPLLFGHQIQPGTHITAVGSDGGGKRELDATIFKKTALVALDSRLQCSSYGEFSYVKQCDEFISQELGELLEKPYQRSEGDITIADLTGVAVEDLQIAKGVFFQLNK